MGDSLQESLIKDLLIESFDGLDSFDREMMAMEKAGSTPQTLNSVFRVIHTIKGTAGCLGLGKIQSVAHVGENLLSLLRDGKLQITPEMITVLLEYSDAIKTLLRELETTGKQGDGDYSALLKRITDLQTPTEPAKAEIKEAWGLFEDEPKVVTTEKAEAASVAKVEVASAPVIEPATVATPAIATTDTPSSPGWGLFTDEPASPVTADVPTKSAEPAADITISETSKAKAAEVVPKEEPARTGSSITDTAIRVDVEQLDRLMNLVGELVLARNQISKNVAHIKDQSLLNAAQRLNTITSELQESVMKTRMQPIGNVWARFPRIVHDVAKGVGKDVRLEMQGKETELDRTIIEAIRDPLTHVIRNAIDHGIEPLEKRRAAGKPDEGMIVMRAYHEAGLVNIEISDDGGGINSARVRDKAIEKKLLDPALAARMSERELCNLIFLPGLSTAEKVTNVSGRGVGMDVVKTNIEKIGGSVDIFSETGQGTTLKIKIPLTLAIIQALIVTSGSEQFAVPQMSLVELIRLDREAAKKSVETICGTPVCRLRGKLLPLLSLNTELQISEQQDFYLSDSVNILVLQADGQQFGVMVDGVSDTEEIVVKPLSKDLKHLTCYSGATIRGDGNVALILDVLGLAQRAAILTDTHTLRANAKDEAVDASLNKETFLLFGDGHSLRMAIPLSAVARLEEIKCSSIEQSGSQEVVQYRGQILPLIRISKYFSGAPDRKSAVAADPMQVVVYSDQGRSIGLVVGKINEIVEQTITVRRESSRPGITGSVVVNDKVTDLLDVPALILASEYEAKQKHALAAGGNS